MKSIPEKPIRCLWYDVNDLPRFVHRRGDVEDMQDGSDIDEQSVLGEVSPRADPAVTWSKDMNANMSVGGVDSSHTFFRSQIRK